MTTTATLTTQIDPASPQTGFANEPFVDFKTPENARAMQAALDLVGSQLGREYDLVIGGRHSKTEGKIRSFNPARPAQLVGLHQKAGAEHAQEAMTARTQNLWNTLTTSGNWNGQTGSATAGLKSPFQYQCPVT